MRCRTTGYQNPFWRLRLPVADKAPIDIPWYAPEKAMTPVRPVTFRASFSAASTASAPVGPQN